MYVMMHMKKKELILSTADSLNGSQQMLTLKFPL